jgi:hypothetical protein
MTTVYRNRIATAKTAIKFALSGRKALMGGQSEIGHDLRPAAFHEAGLCILILRI